MAQHDYTIANQGFPAFRSDLNDALAAIVSNNSGATEPTTMFAHQMWVDTAANPSVLKIRNADNDAWITIGTIDQTGDTFTLTSAVSATTLNTSGAVVFNDAGADVDFRVEGDTQANLLFVDAGNDRVGISTDSPNSTLQVGGATPGTLTIARDTSSTDAAVGTLAYRNINSSTDLASITARTSGATNTGVLTFATTNAGSSAERMRITSGGYFKASNNGTYSENATQSYHEAHQSGLERVFVVGATNASYASYAQQIRVTRNTTNNTFYALGYFNVGANAYKFQVADSGNVTNTNNSYGSISDVKLKQDIVDASSQWDDIKNLRVRKFRWKSDPDGFMQMGLIAQEAEEVSPGLIDEHLDYEEIEVPVLDDEGNAVLNEDGTPQVTKERNALGTTTKAVKYSVLYMKAVKALQEAMERIETLEASNTALEARIAALENA